MSQFVALSVDVAVGTLAYTHIILAICSDIGLVHYRLRQETVTRNSFQSFIYEAVQELAELIPNSEKCTLVFDRARSHLSITVLPKHAEQFSTRNATPLLIFWERL